MSLYSALLRRLCPPQVAARELLRTAGKTPRGGGAIKTIPRRGTLHNNMQLAA